MSGSTSLACKYESFNALIKINDPELLLDVFLDQLTPNHTHPLEIEIFERTDDTWYRLTANGCSSLDLEDSKRQILDTRIDPEAINTWFYEPDLRGWFCAYKPLSNKQYGLFLAASDSGSDIDDEYVQLLFSFYCHQLRSLDGTYRDVLTGLYNRRAFNQRMLRLLNKNQGLRRSHQSDPSVFTMIDIDYFKPINDEFGHLYGDEVLSTVARLMTDSFREYDLLFRYGGEEFCAVLMDIEESEVIHALERFRNSVEDFVFPRGNRVTVSVGYTPFDTDLTQDELIDQADKALYDSKHSGRNRISRFSL